MTIFTYIYSVCDFCIEIMKRSIKRNNVIDICNVNICFNVQNVYTVCTKLFIIAPMNKYCQNSWGLITFRKMWQWLGDF